MTNLDTAFDKAVAHIGSSSVSASNDVKLELYAHYKIASTAVTPQSISLSRPGMFDFAGRAKYDAWTRYGSEFEKAHNGKKRDELAQLAKARYIEIAKAHFAFDEGQEVQDTKAPVEEREKTADELLDEDEEVSPPQASASTGGMAVSTMSMHASTTEDDAIWPLHNLASRGDVQGIKALQPSQSHLNGLDSNGFAPIHLAADKGDGWHYPPQGEGASTDPFKSLAGHAQVVRLLIELGADPNRLGMSALDTAEAVENTEIVEILRIKCSLR